MPRIFNRIRKQLAVDNKFFQYSRYAIGEILLVVIGILIALQIDSWNEERKNKAIVHLYFDQLLEGFDRDQIFIKELSSHLDSTLNNYNSYLRIIENPELSIDSSLYHLSSLDWSYSEVIFQSTTINTLQSTGDIKLIPPEIRTKLIDLKTLQERTLSTHAHNKEVWGQNVVFPSRLLGGGG